MFFNTISTKTIPRTCSIFLLFTIKESIFFIFKFWRVEVLIRPIVVPLRIISLVGILITIIIILFAKIITNSFQKQICVWGDNSYPPPICLLPNLRLVYETKIFINKRVVNYFKINFGYSIQCIFFVSLVHNVH